VVDFNWYLIPEQYRKSESIQPGYPGSAGVTAKPATDTLVHESGNVDPPKQQ
jgi:hypothetical protein